MSPEKTWAAKLPFVLLLLTFAAAALASKPPSLTESLDVATKRYTVGTTKSYEDVLDDLEFSISQYNYRVTGRNHIGQAIAQSELVGYPRSAIIHFCNLRAAREILDINPDFLLHMPCRVSLRENKGIVLVEARLVPETDPRTKEIALRINAMMRDIADYAAQ